MKKMPLLLKIFLLSFIIIQYNCYAISKPAEDIPQTGFRNNSDSAAGINELKDVAALYYKLYETYIITSSDGEISLSDLPYLVAPAMLLFPAFNGASGILSELSLLNDEGIAEIMLMADSYELGPHAKQAKQILKTILILAQTYFIFKV